MSESRTCHPPENASTGPNERDVRRFSVGPPTEWESDTSQLWISPNEICIAFVGNAIAARLIQTKLPSGCPVFRGGVVYLLTRDHVLASTFRSIQELHDHMPGVFFDINRGVAMRPALLRELRVIDNPKSKWIVVRPRGDEPGTYCRVVYVKVSRSRYRLLRRRLGLARLRDLRKRPIPET